MARRRARSRAGADSHGRGGREVRPEGVPGAPGAEQRAPARVATRGGRARFRRMMPAPERHDPEPRRPRRSSSTPPPPTPPGSTAPPLGVEPAVLLREVAALPAPAAGDVDVLLEEASFVFDEQGRATATYRLLFRPLGREAAARWGDVAHAWSPWHQARPELAARVIAPDGAEHRLDPATLVESGLGRDGDGLLSDRRVLQGPLPALEPGAVVEEVQTVRELAPLFEAGTVRRFPVGRDLPARAIRLRIEAPPALPLAWRLRGGLTGAPEEARAGGRKVLTWTWRDVPARRAEEPLTPPDAASQPHVAISTGRSWRGGGLGLRRGGRPAARRRGAGERRPRRSSRPG